jgi:hypothetical protein
MLSNKFNETGKQTSKRACLSETGRYFAMWSSESSFQEEVYPDERCVAASEQPAASALGPPLCTLRNRHHRGPSSPTSGEVQEQVACQCVERVSKQGTGVHDPAQPAQSAQPGR